MIRRFSALLCCFLLVFTVLIPSFHAASIPGQYDVVDLLASGFFPEGELSVTKSASIYSFTWDVTASSSMAFVYLNVYAPSAPSSVTLNGISGTRVYSGAFYQYKFSISKVLSTCTVKVNFSSSAYRTVSIGYAVGAVSGQTVFTSYSRRSRGFSATAWSTPVTVQIPGGGSFGSVISDDVPLTQRVNDFELSFDCSLSSADYFTVHLLVPAGAVAMADDWRTAFATAPSFFLGSAGTHTYPLDIINIESYYDAATQIGYGRGSWHMVYTVDVSGYKLDTYDVMCDFTLFGVQSPDNHSKYGFHYSCLSACLGIDVDSGSPWRIFISWLNTQFAGVKTAISTFSNSVVTQFANLKSNLSAWITALGNKIVNAINPTIPSDVSDVQDDVDSKVDSMDQFEQQQYDVINNGVTGVQSGISTGVGSFGSALAFVQKYTTNISAGISDYLIIFTLPIFIGIFFYICNRIGGITKIKISKGGDH